MQSYTNTDRTEFKIIMDGSSTSLILTCKCIFLSGVTTRRLTLSLNSVSLRNRCDLSISNVTFPSKTEVSDAESVQVTFKRVLKSQYSEMLRRMSSGKSYSRSCCCRVISVESCVKKHNKSALLWPSVSPFPLVLTSCRSVWNKPNTFRLCN